MSILTEIIDAPCKQPLAVETRRMQPDDFEKLTNIHNTIRYTGAVSFILMNKLLQR